MDRNDILINEWVWMLMDLVPWMCSIIDEWCIMILLETSGHIKFWFITSPDPNPERRFYLHMRSQSVKVCNLHGALWCADCTLSLSIQNAIRPFCRLTPHNQHIHWFQNCLRCFSIFNGLDFILLDLFRHSQGSSQCKKRGQWGRIWYI